MKAGELDQQIEVQRPLRAANTLGEQEPQQWETVAKPWAGVVTQKAGEIVSLHRTASERRAVFKVREPFACEADWRVVWNGERYAIEGVTRPPRSGFAWIETHFVSGSPAQ